jgi:hypothetical protein
VHNKENTNKAQGDQEKHEQSTISFHMQESPPKWEPQTATGKKKSNQPETASEQRDPWRGKQR